MSRLAVLFAAVLLSPSAWGAATEGEPQAVQPQAVGLVGRAMVEPASPSVTAHRATVIAAIRSVFGPRAPRAIAVSRCESKLNARAISDTNDWGVFQLNRPTWDPALNPRARPYWPKGKDWRHVLDPLVNAQVAYRISERGTNFWRHWRWSAWCWA